MMTFFVILCLGFFSRHVYNELRDEEHLLHIAHGKVEVEMQRRQDAVTKCRRAVERYREIEGRIHGRLITLGGLTRSHGNNTARSREKNEVLELMRELEMVKEHYPALKAKDPYALLMEIIQESGGRVTMERLNYNERVYEYNVICRIFPYGIFAWIFGFRGEHFPAGAR